MLNLLAFMNPGRLPKHRRPGTRFLRGVLSLLALVPCHATNAQERVALLGDSITHHGGWATWVESALRATPRFKDAEIVNLGLASETISGLSEPGHAGGRFPRPDLHERLDRVLTEFKPTRVLACYGMNDGIYQPADPARMRAFAQGAERLKQAVEKAGSEIVFITAPLHDADKPATPGAFRYDEVLDLQARWLNGRRTAGWKVIDIRPDLKAAVAAAKRADPGFVYTHDGVHPDAAGHRFIAEAVCRQLWKTWRLPAEPEFCPDAAYPILARRNQSLKLAWLTHTRHTRPEVPAGMPLDRAEEESARLLAEYRAVLEPRVSSWHGYERTDGFVHGRAALWVRPKQAAPGKPWIWRTEFFGHEPQADLALLAKGWHVVYIDLQNLYGAPVALDAMDRFYDHLRREHALAERVILEGFSRGGLFAFNWAARRPERVAGLYVDAPVCDFKSWPGGKGRGPGSPEDWQRLLRAYGITEAEALAYDGNPVDRLAPLAKAGIPILAVIGEADEIVPVAENIDLVEKRYRALGGPIKVIRKPGVKHHPHSLEDPAPIVDFALSTSP